MHLIKKLAIITLLCQTISLAHSKVVLDEEIEQKIDSFIGTLLSCREVLGMILAIVQDNNILLTKGYGQADVATGRNATEKSRYVIASTTKAFAATLLGLVMEETGVSWDTPVRAVLGEDFYFAEWELSEAATLRDLLAHQMGTPSHNNLRLRHDLTRSDIAQRIRFAKRTERFRSSYLYNNLLYGLLSHVTEVLGGDTWENLMTSRLLQPLGMNATSFAHVLSREEFEADLAQPYLRDTDGTWQTTSYDIHRYWARIGGSGSIVTNAEDIAQWLLLQTNMDLGSPLDQILEDTRDRNNIIPQRRDDELYRRPNSPVSYIYDEYCLGWRRGYYRGYTMLMHTGSVWGYGSQCTVIPDLNIGLFTSTSGPDDDERARKALHIYVLDLLAGVQPFLNETNACTYPEDWSQRSSQDDRENEGSGHYSTEGRFRKHSLRLSEVDSVLYEGEYGNFLYGNLSVALNDSSGQLQLSYGLGLWDLYTTENNHTFSAQGLNDVWFFTMDDVIFGDLDEEAGVMTSVTLPDFESRDPPVFVRDLAMSEAPAPDTPDCKV